MSYERPKLDSLARKIIKMYANYGMDTTGMAEDELERLKEIYSDGKSNIDADLKQSEKYAGKFVDDIL